jgi:YidC/Oxa1 family membrane protein insertase
MQGDPSQQRIFQFMPLIFTVFMLFLPAGLGVYMLTNTVLGMIQMVIVEQQMKRQLAPQATVRVVGKENAKI